MTLLQGDWNPDPFRSLGNLHDDEIAILLRQVDVDDPAVALGDDEFKGYRERLLGLCDGPTGERLKAAEEDLKDNVLSAMSPEKREGLCNHMEWLGPVRLSCVGRGSGPTPIDSTMIEVALQPCGVDRRSACANQCTQGPDR